MALYVEVEEEEAVTVAVTVGDVLVLGDTETVVVCVSVGLADVL